MERLQYELIPEGEASDFNQALMELGALVCTPKAPHCLICPVMERCAGRLEGKEERLPVKTKAKPPRPEFRACALVIRPQEGQVLIRRRPEKGMLAGMWELPHMDFAEAGWPVTMDDASLGEALRRWLVRELSPVIGETTAGGEPAGVWEHTFSHLHWHLRVHRFILPHDFPSEVNEPYRWADRETLRSLPLPNVFVRILKSAGFVPA